MFRSAENRYMPVSYTHLDVYKRQHQNSADTLVHALQFEAAKSVSGWTSHKVRVLKVRDGTDDEEEAVSYTHLDVYKRQV